MSVRSKKHFNHNPKFIESKIIYHSKFTPLLSNDGIGVGFLSLNFFFLTNLCLIWSDNFISVAKSVQILILFYGLSYKKEIWGEHPSSHRSWISKSIHPSKNEAPDRGGVWKLNLKTPLCHLKIAWLKKRRSHRIKKWVKHNFWRL